MVPETQFGWPVSAVAAAGAAVSAAGFVAAAADGRWLVAGACAFAAHLFVIAWVVAARSGG